MLNQDKFYNPIFPEYDNSNYGNYNNYIIPNKYNSKALKTCNCCLSLKEEKNNSKTFNILTDKINLTSNYNTLNKIISENSKIDDFKEYNEQKSSVKNFSNHSTILTNNNSRINIHSYIPINNRIKVIGNRSKNKDNNHNKNNCLRKKFSSIALSYYNQNIQPDNNNSSYYNANYNYISYYNQPFIKHNSHSLFKKNVHYINDTLNTDISTKNIYIENNFQKVGENFDINSNENKDIEYIKNNNYTNNNCNSNRRKVFEGLNKKSKLNIIHNNNPILTKIVKNTKKNDDNYPNQNLSSIYSPSINKNINYSKIENIDTNKLINKYEKNENKKKINSVINIINPLNNKKFDNCSSNNIINLKRKKKMSLNSSPNRKYNLDIKNNHTFYEIKSLSKDLSQKNLKTSIQIFNNNGIINSIFKNKKDIKYKVKNEKVENNSSNDKTKEDKYMKNKIKESEKNINLSVFKNCLKNKGEYPLERKKSKENVNKSEINYNDFKAIKENINTNNININNINYYTYNNNFTSENKNCKNNKIEINLYNNNYEKNKGIKRQNQIDKNKNSINNFENIVKKKEYLIDLNKRNKFRRIPSGKILNKKNSKIFKVNKIYSSFFSFLPSKIDSKPKKLKKGFNKKNIIQLNTIINKIYKEDFPYKEKVEINNINNNLKPQNAIRIVLFGNQEPKNEKYFIVNIFYSENIRDKPDESESDF